MSVFSAGGMRLKASEIRDDGTAVYTDVPVFRSGTFKDSMGYQHTYDPEHMTQLEFHHTLLKERGIFPEPPVRADHSISVRNVIGYIETVRASKSTTSPFTYLLATFEVTEPDDVQRIERGTFRFRSAEIGYYETNDEAMYWPVFMGFAFVDMPAVEGLDQYARSDEQHFALHITDHKEPPVPPDPTPTPRHEFTLNGVRTTDYSAVQAALDAAKSPTRHAFRVNGAEVTDPAAVQAHINGLEEFRTEAKKAARLSFVKALAEKNVIPASDLGKFEKHVAELTDDGFEGFKGLYEGAEANPLFAQHDASGGTGPAAQTPGDDKPDKKEVDEEVVANLRRAGVPEAQIEKTAAYRRLHPATA